MRDLDPFASRMRELDALVEQCRLHTSFAGVMRDTSNRSERDWPWWSIEIEQTDTDGSETRRATATIRLNSTQAGEPGSFEGRWMARIWQGVGVDTFRETGGWPLAWERPTPQMLEDTMTALLDAAHVAINQDLAKRKQLRL